MFIERKKRKSKNSVISNNKLSSFEENKEVNQLND